MAKKHPRFWNYQQWEDKKEEERRKSYLERIEIQKKEELEKQNSQQNQQVEEKLEQVDDNNKNKVSKADNTISESQSESIQQISYFDLFPDGVLKSEAKNKRGRKTDFKKLTDLMLKEEKIRKEAYLVPEACFANKTIDDVIDYIETLASGPEKINVVVEFKGKKYYSILDNKESCYMKYYGIDYKEYLANDEDEMEM